MRELAQSPLEAQAPGVNDGTWSELVIGTRTASCSVYDPSRQRMVVFGGVDSTYRYLNDTWVLALNGTPRWYQLEPTGALPRARQNASMVYDSHQDRIVIYGGRAGGAPYYPGDVWALSLASPTQWVDLTPASGPRPSARYSHTAVYDPMKDRMVMFGGWDTLGTRPNDVWTLSLSSTPAWSTLTTTGTPPAGRQEHSAIYDPIRQRMVMYGGNTAAGNTYDVWTLTLGTTGTWTLLAPTGLAPYVHTYTSAVYDPVGDRMLVYGGAGAGSWYSYVWALTLSGTPAWSTMIAVAPMPAERTDHVAVFDVPRNRLVAFGGMIYSTAGTKNDVWEFPLTTMTWNEISPTGTSPGWRNFAAGILDSLRSRMIVFGGLLGGGGMRNDVWALSYAGAPVWGSLAPTGTPPPIRYGASAIYDRPRDRMIVFGGQGSGYPGFVNDVWALSLASPAWTQLTPTGTPPATRAYHSAIYDPVRDRMIVFGGHGWDGTFIRDFNDVWALSLASPSWSEIVAGGVTPINRYSHSAIHDPVRDRMIVFGGSYGVRLNDVLALSLGATPTWTALAPTGTPPSAREGPNAIYDPVRDRMVMCGGIPGGPSMDTWAMSLGATPAWTQLSPAGALPDARGVGVVGYDAPRDRLILCGGANYRNETWALRWSNSVSVEPGLGVVPGIALRAPVPNPAHGDVTLAFALPRAGRVSLCVYDVRGRLVRTLVEARREAGSGSARWDLRDGSGARVRPGVYFARLVAPEAKGVRKVVVVE